MITFLSVSLCIGYDVLDFSNIKTSFKSIGSLIIGTFFSLTFFKVNAKAYDDFFDEIKTNFMLQGEFKQILDNLEESIIIVNKKQFEYANDKFLAENHSLLKKIIPEPLLPLRVERPSFLRVLNGWFKYLKQKFRPVENTSPQNEEQ
jgi:hypothetical protein